MRRIYINLLLLFSGIVIFILCLVFLFLNQGDNIVRFVPDTADLYFHAKINKLALLKPEQQAILYGWLGQNGALSEKQWRGIMPLIKNEFTIYKENNELTVIAHPNKPLAELLAKEVIVSSPIGSFIVFPSDDSSFSPENSSSFAKLKRKINFSDFSSYARNLNVIHGFLTNLGESESQPVIIDGDIEKNKIELVINESTSLMPGKKMKPQIKTLDPSTQYYFLNIDQKNAEKLAENSQKSLDFQILTKLNGPKEYQKTSAWSSIFITKRNNTLEGLKLAITTTLATFQPAEKAKVLPDDTIATQLIADPTQWSFVELPVNAEGFKSLSLTADRLNLGIIVKETKDQYQISINSLNLVKSSQPTSTTIAKSPCFSSKFSKNSIIYINKNAFSATTFFNNLVIRLGRKSSTVCID